MEDSNIKNSIIKNLKEQINDILLKYKLEKSLIGHLKRTSKYAEILSESMNVEKEKIEEIKKGALLHDIGKKRIDKNLLEKQTKLSLDEFKIIKEHPKLGTEELNEIDESDIVRNIILLHHEKWDGSGYPFGLIGTKIPIEARIVSVADCYDALTTVRVYKEKVSHEKAIKILKSESGKKYDPDIILKLELLEKEFNEIFIENK